MSVARRRRTRLTWAACTGAALLAVGILVPLPFVELSPGPTFNVIGEVDGQQVIEISGTPTFPTGGNLDMTTVNERGGPGTGIYLGRVLVGWLDREVRILPRGAIFPDDQRSDAEVKADNVRLFSDSQADSVAAALTFLRRPFRTLVVVNSVRDGTPADGKLEPGDEIVKVDATVVTEPADVTRLVGEAKPGDTVTVTISRSGVETAVPISTKVSPVDPDRAYLGITVGETYEAPFAIDVTLDGVGGPSAGLFFSLGIVDKLTPGELTGGRFVAGTGTITPDGSVGPIGGIEQKLVGARSSGATLFLAPAENCDEVLATGVPEGLTVARVSTLAEAVTAIEDYVAGRPARPCG